MATALEPKVKPDEIVAAAAAVSAVKSIDAVLEWLARDVDREAKEWGGELRSRVLGSNRMSSKLTDAHLGKAMYCGVMNALLLERAEVAAGWDALVDFPGAPCGEILLTEILKS